jgi:kynureninase
MQFEFSETFAKTQDQNDALAAFRKEFLFPKHKDKEVIYFTGNSLGLQPKGVQAALMQELNDWAEHGVEGHFRAKNPWFSYHELLSKGMAAIVGAKETEVVAMNGLSANLHFLFVSFYRPSPKRYKIIMEAKAFPSDQYIVESQVKFHGYKPEDAIIEVEARNGSHCIEEEDILAAIEKHKDSLALVFWGGVNYYTGQAFDMNLITQSAHKAGAMAGFDLAHAAGNLHLQLHQWNADFAAWCTYKYLNSGPGSVSGIFIHEKHHSDTQIPRFTGWWGYDKKDRFKMEKGFKPIPTAEAWQLSNAPVLSMAPYKVSLDLFEKTGIERLVEKSKNLTAYLEFIVKTLSASNSSIDFEIITPSNPKRRGAQLSLLVKGRGKDLFDKLTEQGVVVDWREPNVIRMAPTPMYNSFEDVYRFGKILEKIIQE